VCPPVDVRRGAVEQRRRNVRTVAAEDETSFSYSFTFRPDVFASAPASGAPRATLSVFDFRRTPVSVHTSCPVRFVSAAMPRRSSLFVRSVRVTMPVTGESTAVTGGRWSTGVGRSDAGMSRVHGRRELEMCSDTRRRTTANRRPTRTRSGVSRGHPSRAGRRRREVRRSRLVRARR